MRFVDQFRLLALIRLSLGFGKPAYVVNEASVIGATA